MGIRDEQNYYKNSVKKHLKQLISSRYPTYLFWLKCKLSTTCKTELGCDLSKRKFTNYFQRHRCISDDRPPTDPVKYIVNPSAMWYAFVHGIPRWRDNASGKRRRAIPYKNGLCVHMRDHHWPTSNYQHVYMQQFVLQFSKVFQQPNETKVLPYLSETRKQYCTY